MQHNLRTIRRTLPPLEWRTLIKPVMVACVLLLSAAVGQRVSMMIVIGLGAGLAAVLGYLVLTRRMEWGILAVLPATFLVTRTISTGRVVTLNSTILVLAALFAVWMLNMLVIKKQFRLVSSPINTPALLFILAVTISLPLGNLPLVIGGQPSNLPAQIGGWLIYVFSAGSLLLVGNHIRDARWLKWFLWLFLGLGALYLAACWMYGIRGAEVRFFKGGISGAVFWTMLAAIGFGQALCNRDLAWRWRILAGSITVLALAFGWIRGKEWLAGWLPPLLAMWVILWLHNWKLGLFATVAGALAILPMSGELYSRINSDAQQWSTYSRFLTWPIMLELVKVNPIFGLGPTNYYQYTALYPLYGYYVQFNSHNQYWDIAAQTGLLGLGTFLWMVIAVARLGFSVLRRARDSFTRSYAITAMGVFAASLAAGMMADWLMPFLYNIGFPGFRTSVMAWLLLGGLISLNTDKYTTPSD